MGLSTAKKLKPFIGVFADHYGKYKRQIILLVILGFVAGVFEGIGINALIPLFSLAAEQGGQADDSVSQSIQRVFAFVNIPFTIKYILFFILGLFLMRTLIVFLYHYVKIRISADYEEAARIELLKKTLGASWSFILSQKAGKHNAMLTTFVEFGARGLIKISAMIMAMTVTAVYVVIAFNISTLITVLSVALALVSFVLFKPFFVKTKIVSSENARVIESVMHKIEQFVVGMKTVKAMGVADQAMESGKEHFRKFNEFKVKVYLYRNYLPATLQFVSIVFVCLIFGISYKMENFNLGMIIAMVYIIQRIFTYLQRFQLAFHQLLESLSYMEKVTEYKKDISGHVEDVSGAKEFRFEKNISFEDVTFSYANRTDVLSTISFSIEKGSSVALIGPSGAGKTTVVDLLLRLFTPTGGAITADGEDISEIDLEKWRDHIGYISQDIFLINDTIENNIRFHDESVTDADVKRAAKMANIDTFVDSLPGKYQTVIGERGLEVSAGQRQRIVIARVLARNPDILILDEATSALDNESEKKVQTVIDELKGKVTTFVVAHRLTTVLNVDTLLVLDGGKIVEQGSPKKLLEDKQSYFYRMYHLRD